MQRPWDQRQQTTIRVWKGASEAEQRQGGKHGEEGSGKKAEARPHTALEATDRNSILTYCVRHVSRWYFVDLS